MALEARYGLPPRLAPLARLHVPGISRDQLLRLYRNERGVEFDKGAVPGQIRRVA